MPVELLCFDLKSPDDLTELRSAIMRINPDRIRRLALLMKVSGEYQDGSRERARAAVHMLLSATNLDRHTEFVTVVGCEGASTPCGYALIDILAETKLDLGEPGLAIGLARNESPPENALGTVYSAMVVRRAVEEAMQDGKMTPDDVAVVIVNVPEPTTGDVRARSRRARAAAALGAGEAIGEIDGVLVTEANILHKSSLFTHRVQTFTGPAIKNVEVIVIGNLKNAGGNLFACSTVTTDLFDGRSIKRMLVERGFTLDSVGEIEHSDRIVAIIAKSGVSPDGFVTGAPTTIFGSAIPPEKHVRAALSGMVGATLHTTRVFSTFDPVQQAPLGGGTICCIVREAPDKLADKGFP